MCGIVGIFDTLARREIDLDVLSRMNESQKHRGPDECGLHREPGLGFGHRRLSIIDLSSGQQPLFSQDKSVVVTYNGEIYNFQAIKAELVSLGYAFKTHCDTEVIVYAWLAWGECCVDKFRGMFAFALWDRSKQTLFLARDRLGVKPLYYASLKDGHFIFSSELKALKVHPLLQRNIDPTAVEDYFALGYVPDPKTIYKNVYKLEPGYRLTLKRGDKKVSPERYWDAPFASQDMNESFAVEALIEKLRDSVSIRMIADVPLGAFLSGGVDSSAVVAMMAGLSNSPVKTCSISFKDPQYDESSYAARVAAICNTDHRIERVDRHDFSLIERLASLYDEPFADSSALPTYRVCQLARRSVTVALSGDGGDEMLAGYRRYRWHSYEEAMRGLMPNAIRKPLFGFLGRVYPKADWAPKVFRAKSTFQALGRDSLEGYFHGVALMHDEMRDELFTPEFKRELQDYRAIEIFRAHASKAPCDHPLSWVQYLDLKTYLPGDILTKVDRASMAHGLEVRVPLLDYRLVEWMSSIPPALKLQGGEGKYIFKKALQAYLPHDVLYRKKMGFSVPLADWFRGEGLTTCRDALLSQEMADSGCFNFAYLNKMFDRHQSGVRDESTALWALLMYQAFLKHEMNG